MALSSMTGYGRADGVFDGRSWVWEMRSVNGRNLDLKFRIPSSVDTIESRCRKLAQEFFARGNIQVGLSLEKPENSAPFRINENALQHALALTEQVNHRIDGTPLRATDILQLPGVIEKSEEETKSKDTEALLQALIAGFKEAAQNLKDARQEEGAHLQSVLSDLIDQISDLSIEARNNPTRTPEAIKLRITGQIALLSETELDKDRLHQEAMFLASKADIQEELDRVEGHIASARSLLRSTSAVGRKFDFLTQEFNREANTLCSKSNHSSLTRTGLAMKAVVDQLREQIQNVE